MPFVNVAVTERIKHGPVLYTIKSLFVTKAIHVCQMYSLHFSNKCLMVRMWSIVENPLRKPACLTGCALSNNTEGRRHNTLEKTIYIYMGEKAYRASILKPNLYPFLCCIVTAAFSTQKANDCYYAFHKIISQGHPPRLYLLPALAPLRPHHRLMTNQSDFICLIAHSTSEGRMERQFILIAARSWTGSWVFFYGLRFRFTCIIKVSVKCFNNLQNILLV